MIKIATFGEELSEDQAEDIKSHLAPTIEQFNKDWEKDITDVFNNKMIPLIKEMLSFDISVHTEVSFSSRIEIKNQDIFLDNVVNNVDLKFEDTADPHDVFTQAEMEAKKMLFREAFKRVVEKTWKME